jgi:hypothetical protein
VADVRPIQLAAFGRARLRPLNKPRAIVATKRPFAAEAQGLTICSETSSP